jgi:hypothetical protein
MPHHWQIFSFTIARTSLALCFLEGEKFKCCNNGLDIFRPFAKSAVALSFPSEASPEVDLDGLDVGIAK